MTNSLCDIVFAQVSVLNTAWPILHNETIDQYKQILTCSKNVKESDHQRETDKHGHRDRQRDRECLCKLCTEQHNGSSFHLLFNREALLL